MVTKILVFSLISFGLFGCATLTPKIAKKQIKVKKIANKQVKIEDLYKLKDREKIVAFTNYLIKKELKIAKPIFPNKPSKPTLPKAEQLKKGEYEKTKTFKLRVEKERVKRAKKIEAIKTKYAKDVQNYNKRVKKLTDDYNNAVAKKEKNIKSITIKAMAKAYVTVYGKPYLENSLKYDADTETFYGTVKSTKGNFSEKVSIKVPLAKAQNFDKDVASLKTDVIFNLKGNKLSLKKIAIHEKKRLYLAQLNSSDYKVQDVRVAINGGSLNMPSLPLLSSSLAISDDAYNIGEVSYSKDPEIARLQKKQIALQEQARAKKSSAKREVELQKQKEALEAQIAQLEQKSGGYNDIPTLLRRTKEVQKSSKKWLFIVGIENYEFTNPVVYSKNSAKSFKIVAQKRLGILKKNTFTLINEDATSGKIRYALKTMLAHVKKGDTIYFYYSGHGIPVPSQHNAPYMLAQDMSPEYVTDNEKFKLQNIYKLLSSSKASEIVAFIDSCFSGGTDNQTLLKGVAATRLKPKKVTFNKRKMVVISAGSGTQYSNKYDKKSNRLFSYYIMRGLMKNNTNTQRLYDYVKSNVQEKSYEMGASYEQVPVYHGNIKLKL